MHTLKPSCAGALSLWTALLSTMPAAHASTLISADADINDGVTVATLRDRPLEELVLAGAVDTRPDTDFLDNYADDAGDPFFFAPGVEVNAPDIQEPRIVLRGFGLGNGQHRSTALILRDGAPLTDVHGATNFTEIAPLAIARAEIERGVVELRNGGENLGGVVNFISKRGGRDATGFSTRFDGGATIDGKPGGQAHMEIGGAGGSADYYASLDGVYENGWRDNNRRTAEIFHGNVGFAPHERLETRFFVDVSNTETELAGGLTASDLQNDAQSPTPPIILGPLFPGGPIINLLDGARADDFARDNQSGRIANATSLRLFGHDIEIGGRYAQRKVDSPQNDFVGYLREDGNEWGARLSIAGETKAFGSKTQYQLGGQVAKGTREVERFENDNGAVGDPISSADQRSKNFSAFVQGSIAPLRRLVVDLGAKFVSVRRETTDLADNGTDERRYTGVAARGGLKYDLSEAVQIFVSAERGYEPPTTDELTAGDPGDFIGLEEQDSFGFSGGVRGRFGRRIGFDLVYFDIGVENEIINVADPSSFVNNDIFDNAFRTKHKGVEAAVDVLLMGRGADEPALTLRNVYQYSNFRFKDGGSLGDVDGNRLGGVPAHAYRGELRYDAVGAWFVAANVSLVGGAYYADHANSFDVPSETVVGFSAGYRFNDRIELYASGENLTDAAYAAGVTPVLTLDPANDRVFTPGQRASVYAGMAYRF